MKKLGSSTFKGEFKIIKEDIRDCHKTLLAVCEGRFPKQDLVDYLVFGFYIVYVLVLVISNVVNTVKFVTNRSRREYNQEF